MKKFRQFRSNQGCDPKKQKSTYIVLFIAYVAMLLIIICVSIFKILI